MNTSLRSISPRRACLPSPERRSSTTPRLPRFTLAKTPLMPGSGPAEMKRVLSPAGGSTLITSAPMSAMIWVQYGPITIAVRSTTRTPDSGPLCSMRTSGDRLVGCVPEDALGLQIVVEAELAPLAPVAALLVAAERAAEVEAPVDRDPSGPDPAGDGTGLFQIGARHIAGQSVLGVVGDLDGVVEIVITEDRGDRPEDLLPGDG